MDTKNIFGHPLVVAKPLRGREMQTTVISKDIMNTIRAVSAKKIENDIALQSLKKPRDGDVEIFHEGYVDGKLFLVPDSNLQAMRDIVNLKMRRRHSSTTKPQTSLDEPTKYTEFSSKLDCLLDKVDQLADSSEDDESENTRTSKSSEKKKKRRFSKQSDISSQLDSPTLEKELTRESHTLPIINEEPETKSISKKFSEKSFESKDVAIPPIMDETIKYKRVKPKEPSKQEKYMQDHHEKQQPDKKVYSKYKEKDLSEELTTEIFRVLISGHIKNGYIPIFIVHKDYVGPNILQNHVPDFKTHKKEGNIDIYLSGKFFTENILLEASSESPAMLNVDPHKITIEKSNYVHRKKFKDTYSVGSVDIVFEGEFKKDKITTKYTPVLTLEIMKNASFQETASSESNFPNPASTTVMYGKPFASTPFTVSQQKSVRSGNALSKQKHVHYENDNNQNVLIDEEMKNGKYLKVEGIWNRVRKHNIYKTLFNKNKETSKVEEDIDKGSVTSSQLIRPRFSKQRREELAKSRRLRLRERKALREKLRKGQAKQKNDTPFKTNTSIQCYRSLEKKSPVELKVNLSKQISDGIAEESVIVKKVVKIRKKKQDKNQAIVENPILAQMQEFFLG